MALLYQFGKEADRLTSQICELADASVPVLGNLDEKRHSGSNNIALFFPKKLRTTFHDSPTW